MRAHTIRRTLAAAFLLVATAPAQQPPTNGPRPVDAGWHALVGGTAVVAPGQKVENATIVVRGGRIVSVATAQAAPEGAKVWDCEGLTIYAGLVEPYLPIEAPEVDPALPGQHFNPKVAPQRRALEGGEIRAEQRQKLLRAGFAAAAIAPDSGIFRGQSAVVVLRDAELDPESATVRADAYQTVGFDRGGGYPGSEMGVVAVLRQTLADADWHERSQAARKRRPAEFGPVPPRPALEALQDRNQTLWFEASDELQTLRGIAVAQQFGRPYVVVASGLEFRRLDAVAATGTTLVLPVDFPDAPDVTTLDKAQRVSLRDLMTWEQAPTNPFRVDAAEIPAVFTTFRLDDPKLFHDRVREAIAHGLPRERAVAMVTIDAARLLGVEQDLGTIAAGRLANFTLVADGELFEEDAEIHSVWVRGVRTMNKADEPRTIGKWQMVVDLTAKADATLVVKDGSVEIERGETKAKGKKVTQRGRHLDFMIDGDVFGVDGMFRMSAHGEGPSLFGSGIAPDGSLVRWSATRAPEAAVPEDGDPEDVTPEDVAVQVDPGGTDPEAEDPPIESPAEPPVQLRKLPLPLGAYGREVQPAAQNVVLTGATVWTSGPSGILQNAAVWIQDGKIRFVGRVGDLPDLPTGTQTLAVNDKHITPGLIDCHSHTGISRGINESGEAVTSEVRIQDVVDPDHIGWYRQLAGGVTTVNQLHGSANAIGGQSHVAKLRWGAAHPNDLTLQGAPGGIKFALGENPRRANSSSSPTRYPSTRMGVAALIRDRFVAAVDYRREWVAYEALGAAERAAVMPPRRDLELEALVEILDGERFIHCHSYRQDEIFMLCRLADEFGFKIGTLQHVLEGYKVADAIKQSAKGASAFSDWWAYKLEVFDAIPHNGALMHQVGVVVSFNSDSNELARRLNTEAGKAVKYGGVPAPEALKFVTLNPAIQLGIDDRVGSLEPGKDADLVLWSDHPLSYRARALTTWVDGRPLYTVESDAELRLVAERERQRLVQKALVAERIEEPRSGRGRRRGARYWFTSRDYSCCDNLQEAR